MCEGRKRTTEEIRREQGIDAPEEKKSPLERLKAASHGLRGSILEELRNTQAATVSEDSNNLLKAHGIYQQDNRDTRLERKREGLDKEWGFMVRVKIPGGRLSAQQYLLLDDCATRFTGGSIRLTSRQTIQFHRVPKDNLPPLVQALNNEMLTTQGACGDVVRNVMACPVFDLDPRPEWSGREAFLDIARKIFERTLPRTRAYYDIFLEGDSSTPLDPNSLTRIESEDLYGTSYLPRKFKIGITIPQDNCVEVFTQDLGIVALVDDGRLRGYNLLAGGGLGATHNNPKTFPRLGVPIAFVEPQRLFAAVDAVIGIQRDCGNRLDRKRARLKYLIAEQGPEWLHEEMEKRLGYRLAAPEAIAESEWHVDDHLGWHPQGQPDLCYAGVYVPCGRLVDSPSGPFRSALRGIIADFRPEVRLTPGQSLILAHLSSRSRSEIEARLNDAGLATGPGRNLSVLMRNATSCVALPTCPLALAESERVLPALIRRLEELGFASEAVSIRISGCPNSCSRAPTAEIGLLGRAPGKYNLYAGGSPTGMRLNRLIHENVVFDELPGRIAALLQAWRQDRGPDEAFGDWAERSRLGAQVSGVTSPAGPEPPPAP